MLKLAPFRRQHESLLESVADHSKLVAVAAGPWSPERPREYMYFLRKGRLLVEDPQQARHEVSAVSAAAAFPLPTGERWRIEATSPFELTQVPARYLELANAMHSSESGSSIELLEDDASGEIYLDFYQTLKNGKYELPSLPDLAVRIGKSIDDPNTLNSDIARLIQMDPSLAARVMSVVNSAAYRTGDPIRSLQQAVARLGRQQVRNLVFSCIIKGLFRSDSPVLKKRMQALWAHSCRVAAISFVLARVTPGLDPNRAMLAGLIHDIGAVPILQTARKHPDVSHNAALLDQIIDNLKSEIGPLTLIEWNFDEEMIALAREAEHWHRIGSAVPDYLDVVLLAQLHAFIGTPHQKNLPPIDQIPAFGKLALGQLTPRHSIGVLEHASRDIEEVESILRVG